MEKEKKTEPLHDAENSGNDKAAAPKETSSELQGTQKAAEKSSAVQSDEKENTDLPKMHSSPLWSESCANESGDDEREYADSNDPDDKAKGLKKKRKQHQSIIK